MLCYLWIRVLYYIVPKYTFFLVSFIEIKKNAKESWPLNLIRSQKEEDMQNLIGFEDAYRIERKYELSLQARNNKEESGKEDNKQSSKEEQRIRNAEGKFIKSEKSERERNRKGRFAKEENSSEDELKAHPSKRIKTESLRNDERK